MELKKGDIIGGHIKNGEQVESYILIKRLGEGGQGEVWLATRKTLIEKKFAIKFPLNTEDFEEIEKEASNWNKAGDHLNVLRIIDANIDEDKNLIFIVTEFARDGSLENWLEKFTDKTPPLKDAIDIMLGILAGLEHLHNANIIHRDIKPANILMNNNIPRIADFGISKDLDADLPTYMGFVGSPHYAPPEAYRGKRNAQTDLWAAAVIFYQLLCGRLPFYGYGNNIEKWRDAISYADPVSLPARVPEPLKEIVERGLKKDPNERYKTANEMREALTDALKKTNRQTAKVGETLDDGTPLKPEDIPLPPDVSDPPSVPPPVPPLEPELVINESGKGRWKWWIVLGVAALLLLSIIIFRPNGGGGTEGNNTGKIYPLVVQGEKFVSIPVGQFMMGSSYGPDDERPPHLIQITRSFEMGKYEVTQEEWQAVMGNNPSQFKGETNLPVENVSWGEVQSFIKSLNAKNDGYTYRLPTEAEWEYACRAGTTGDYAGNLEEMAWYSDNSGGTTHPVGQKKPNAWGLYDMHGNVWEWCQDVYSKNYYSQSPTSDPKGATSGSLYVLRGGGLSYIAQLCRAAYRNRSVASKRFYYLGFRLVRLPRQGVKN